MPRDVSGNYTLPSGNPVVDGTIIDVAWANPTMSDIAVQLNNVITRDGVLGATNPIKFASGAAAAPGITFTADPALGVYRVGSGVLGITAAGALVASFATAGIGLFQNLGVGSPSNAGFLAPIDVTTTSGTLGVLIRGRSADGTSMLQFAANNGTTIYGQIQGLSTDFRYAAVNVPHIWFGGASGTTERMRLTSAGLLGLGVSPSVQLHVDAGAANEVARFNSSGDTFLSFYRSNTRRTYFQSSASGFLAVQEENLPIFFYTNNAQRWGISATGVFYPVTDNTYQIGTGSFRVQSVNAIDYNSGVSSMTFTVNGSVRGTWNTSGNLGIGVTPNAAKLGVAGNIIISDGTTPYIALASNQSSTPAYLQYTIATSVLDMYSSGAINFQPSGVTAASLTAAGVFNYGGIEVGWRSIPRASNSATPGTAYRGQCMAATGGVTINNSTFAAGDAFSIYNDSASSITITQGAGLTLRLAGTTTTGNRTLAARGMCTLWFNGASEAVISGAGVT